MTGLVIHVNTRYSGRIWENAPINRTTRHAQPRSGITAAPSRACADQGRDVGAHLGEVIAAAVPGLMFCLIGGCDPVTIARPVG